MQIHLPNRVQECSTTRGKEPRIIIQGEILPEFGFTVGTELQMTLEKERITIIPRTPKINH
jgi:hypothetical protein